MPLLFRQLNPGSCLTYMFGQREGGRSGTGGGAVVLVDPVLDRVREYVALLEREGLRLEAVIDTHTHADHISGGAALMDLMGCAYLMHESAPAPCKSVRIIDGELRTIAGVPMTFLHTPGHTADAMCVVIPEALGGGDAAPGPQGAGEGPGAPPDSPTSPPPDPLPPAIQRGILLTGDTLFLDDGGAGRDDLPGGDAGAHWESLQRLMKLPDGLVVYPAHEYRGRRPSTLGAQKRTNPHLRPRTREEFVSYIQDLRLGPAEWMKNVLRANYACALDPGGIWIPADLPACEIKGTLGPGVNDQKVSPITVEELRARLERGQPLAVLDVREPEELRATGAIAGALRVPIEELGARLRELNGFRKTEVVTVCRTGKRSYTAAQILQQAGFGHVHYLEGGMTRWSQLGYPVER